IPIHICTNSFIDLNHVSLDIANAKYTEYNIFRTNEYEIDAFGSLIRNIENKYGDEAKKIAESAYNNFLEKLNPDFFILMDEIMSDQIKNRNILYSNINFIFININKFINFTNDQITETDGLIIYKVLKSISKFLIETSSDSFLSQIFPEFRIINILYHARIQDHRISGRKFSSGIFLKKILKQKLKDFKVKYQSIQKIDNFGEISLKEILEIRVIYIFTFLNF
ncbi:hypothetical protein DMUE_5348, partial [Dictyocoela muelleri]